MVYAYMPNSENLASATTKAGDEVREREASVLPLPSSLLSPLPPCPARLECMCNVVLLFSEILEAQKERR